MAFAHAWYLGQHLRVFPQSLEDPGAVVSRTSLVIFSSSSVERGNCSCFPLAFIHPYHLPAAQQVARLLGAFLTAIVVSLIMKRGLGIVRKYVEAEIGLRKMR